MSSILAFFGFTSPPPEVEFRRLSAVSEFRDDGRPAVFADISKFPRSDVKMIRESIVEEAHERGDIPKNPWPFAKTLPKTERQRSIEVVLAEHLGLGSLQLEGNEKLIRKLLDKPLQATEPFISEEGLVVYVRPPNDPQDKERYVMLVATAGAP